MVSEGIERQWDADIVPQLIDYIRIPAKSPHFDPQWREHGHIEAAVQLALAWSRRQPVAGMTLEVVRLEGRTPVIFFDIPARGAATSKTVLLYGHLDKQPEMTGWRPGLGPWLPVIEDGRLYGRGGADDGYAIFASLSAIQALDAEGTPRPRCVGLIETCEESGSYDLPAYLDLLAPRMGDVGLVVALDSGAGNYDQLWATTSLRGLVNGTLRVDILTEGVHSGDAGGVVPSSFRIARRLLDRIDDSGTGVVKSAEFSCAISGERFAQAKQAAAILGDTLWKRFPFSPSVLGEGKAGPVTKDPGELVLKPTRRAPLAVTRAAGLPALESAGHLCTPLPPPKFSLPGPPPTHAAPPPPPPERPPPTHPP